MGSDATNLSRNSDVGVPGGRADRANVVIGATADARGERALGSPRFDFYRCGRCHRIMTQLEVIRRIERGKSAALCTCGSLEMAGTGPGGGVRWYHFLRPDVMLFALLRVAGRA